MVLRFDGFCCFILVFFLLIVVYCCVLVFDFSLFMFFGVYFSIFC
jgi:hypothetical protein